MVERVAEILPATMGHDHHHDELRSIAMGWLARPLDLLKLLLEHTDTAAQEVPAWASDHLAETVARITTMPARRLAQLRSRGRLFVHVTDEALRTGIGVARVEGVGPIDVRQLREVLGHADVTVTPVLDLGHRRRVDAYEHPETVKDHVWVQTGGDCFPWTPRSATRDGVDYDHAVPYDDTGPPGQTGPHNLRSPAPTPPPHQDPRGPHHPGRRTGTTSPAHAPRPGVPRRPHRHLTVDRRPGRVDGPGDRRRGRALLQLPPVTL